MGYRGEKYHGGVLLLTFVMLYKSIAVMQAMQNHSIREEGIALPHRMKICARQKLCVFIEK